MHGFSAGDIQDWSTRPAASVRGWQPAYVRRRLRTVRDTVLTEACSELQVALKKGGKHAPKFPPCPAKIAVSTGEDSLAAGTLATPLKRRVLLGAYNHLHSTALSELGGSNEVELFCPLVGQVVQELRRWAQGDKADVPKAGAAGNHLGVAGDQLYSDWQKATSDVMTGMASRTVKLEQLVLGVILVRSRSEPNWRMMGNTLTDAAMHRAKM
ncbi:hypothetical protein COO60DRAFT_1655059 [Scenedesmus sp. NREL 46B-D3]|nr:hypothetical protein COO60DRAFT_1655059 [Scenedesmus sp. NREL 46B-D3]